MTLLAMRLRRHLHTARHTAVWLLVAFLLEAVFAQLVAPAAVAPDFVLATVVALAVTGRSVAPLGVAAVGGLIQDALSAGYVGLNGISKLLVCRVLQNLSASWPPIPLVALGLVAAGAAMVDGLLFAVLATLAGDGWPSFLAVRAFLFGVPFTALYATFVFASVRQMRALTRYPIAREERAGLR